MTQLVDEIIALFERHGDAAYFGEAVSQREHALQVAHLAEQEGAPGLEHYRARLEAAFR